MAKLDDGNEDSFQSIGLGLRYPILLPSSSIGSMNLLDLKNEHDPNNQYWKNRIEGLFESYKKCTSDYKISSEQVLWIQECFKNGGLTAMGGS
ncbi:MAG: hypothetical protein WC774_04180 [Candidatus Gracilibacteria bacterium]